MKENTWSEMKRMPEIETVQWDVWVRFEVFSVVRIESFEKLKGFVCHQITKLAIIVNRGDWLLLPSSQFSKFKKRLDAEDHATKNKTT